MSSTGQPDSGDKVRDPEVLSYATPRRAPVPAIRWFSLALRGILVGVLVAALIGILLPAGGGAHERSKRIYCASHLCQIGQGILLYATDHGGQFPASIDPLVTEDDLNPDVFICPSSKAVMATGPTTQALLTELAKPAHMSYIYVGAGMTMAANGDGDTVVAYEKMENHDKDGMNVLYGDGHVDWFAKDGAAHILSELAAGHNPPRPTSPTTAPGRK